MEVPLSVQDHGEERVGSLPGETRDTKVDQTSIEDKTGAGPQNEPANLSREDVHPQEPDQEEMAVKREGTSSGLEKQKGKGKTHPETDSLLVQTSEGSGKGKEQELREGLQIVSDRSDIKVKSDEESKGQDALMSGQGDEEEMKKIIDSNDKEKDQTVKDDCIPSTVDEKQGKEQKKIEDALKRPENGDEEKQGKNETIVKKIDNISGQADADKKKKKDKKHKSSSERILKKLEKINAKVGRILAKKEEYEVRLKEALERERQESEKTAPREQDASTAGIGKSASDRTGSGLIREETIVKNELRLDDDENTKDASTLSTEKGFSGSLSRTASLIEVTSAELMEEVAEQKRLAEKLGKILASDGSETNPPLPMEDSNLVIQGKGEDLKHTLQVDDSIDNGAS